MATIGFLIVGGKKEYANPPAWTHLKATLFKQVLDQSMPPAPSQSKLIPLPAPDAPEVGGVFDQPEANCILTGEVQMTDAAGTLDGPKVVSSEPLIVLDVFEPVSFLITYKQAPSD